MGDPWPPSTEWFRGYCQDLRDFTTIESSSQCWASSYAGDYRIRWFTRIQADEAGEFRQVSIASCPDVDGMAKSSSFSKKKGKIFLRSHATVGLARVRALVIRRLNARSINTYNRVCMFFFLLCFLVLCHVMNGSTYHRPCLDVVRDEDISEVTVLAAVLK